MPDVKVALVTEYCPPYRTGFYETFADTYDTHVVFCATKETWRAFGDFEYTELPNFAVRDRYHVAPRLAATLRRIDPDVIVGTPVEGFGGQGAYLYARATGTPFVLWTGEWHLPLTTLRTATFPLVRRLYHGADAIAVYGPHIESYLTDLGVDPEKISLAWNTVDTERFAPPHDEEELRRVRADNDIPEDAPLALFVGRLVREKGVDYLLRAFENVHEAWSGTEQPHLLIVGEGDQRETLEASVESNPAVTFAGYVDNERLPAHYGAADVFVLPSVRTEIFREPWGLVVNEAMSAGTPVIATGQVGAAAAGVVDHGTNGFVVPERNITALAERLEQVLSSPERRADLGTNARETIQHYDFERMVDGFTDAFAGLGLDGAATDVETSGPDGE